MLLNVHRMNEIVNLFGTGFFFFFLTEEIMIIQKRILSLAFWVSLGKAHLRALNGLKPSWKVRMIHDSGPIEEARGIRFKQLLSESVFIPGVSQT